MSLNSEGILGNSIGLIIRLNKNKIYSEENILNSNNFL